MIVPDGLVDALLATASDAIIATDRTGIINCWNPGAVRIFGFAADEAIGRSLDLIIPDNLRARHWTGFKSVMETGESHYGHGDLLSVPALTKGGQRISVEFCDRYAEGRAGSSDRDRGNSSRRDQTIRRKPQIEAATRGSHAK
jgi:PAS domain S-box-containing protein